MTRVIFACVHNAGRSQMAAAFFNRLADPAKAQAVSAGTEPAERIHAEVRVVMSEVGLELPGSPQRLTPEMLQGAGLLITLGCGESCPTAPGVERDDWPVSDPKDLAIGSVRQIRDAVHLRVAKLVAARGWQR